MLSICGGRGLRPDPPSPTGVNLLFVFCPCSSYGRPIFQLGFFAQSFWLEMEKPVDNSQSIMSDDSTHSSQYSGPIVVLKVF